MKEIDSQRTLITTEPKNYKSKQDNFMHLYTRQITLNKIVIHMQQKSEIKGENVHKLDGSNLWLGMKLKDHGTWGVVYEVENRRMKKLKCVE